MRIAAETVRLSAPVRVGEVLAAAVPELEEHMLTERIRAEWPSTAGSELARRSRPGELRNGTLTVVVDNSPWLQELTLRAEELLAAVRRRHGQAVTALRLSLGGLPAAPPAALRPRVARATPRLRLTEDEARLVERAAAELDDPVLAATVRRLLTKDLTTRRAREDS